MCMGVYAEYKSIVFEGMLIVETCQCGVVVITSPLHGEGHRFNPGH